MLGGEKDVPKRAGEESERRGIWVEYMWAGFLGAGLSDHFCYPALRMWKAEGLGEERNICGGFSAMGPLRVRHSLRWRVQYRKAYGKHRLKMLWVRITNGDFETCWSIGPFYEIFSHVNATIFNSIVAFTMSRKS